MTARTLAAIFVSAGLAACSGGATPDSAPQSAPATTTGAAQGTAQPAQPPAAGTAVAMQCAPVPRMPVAGRASPYDSTLVTIGDAQAKVCYGRPAARGRTMIGGEHVPFGQVWRTGANEPTIIHLPFRASIAGLEVQPGSYSLYTIPDAQYWTVIVNRSITQWGHESAYTAAVQEQEVGRAQVAIEPTAAHVESFTIRSEPVADNRTNLVLEWEGTRVPIPIARP
jgi:hypothetical protein